jgi:pyridoxine 5-phosphate synthase
MICLSVNVNKIATLRNSRGGHFPRVTDAVTVCLNAGVHGITVHPRADKRHITPEDVRDVKQQLARHKRTSSSTSKAIRGPI